MYRLSREPLITARQIEQRLDTLANEIRPLDFDVILSVLTGSYIFTADLSRRLAKPNLLVKFIRASSYGESTESCGSVKFSGLENIDIRGKRVLVIDDILDTGATMARLCSILNDMGAGLIKTCVLLDKEGRRTTEIEANFVGFNIKNEFVVGYGLDCAGEYRTLPEIWTLGEQNG